MNGFDDLFGAFEFHRKLAKTLNPLSEMMEWHQKFAESPTMKMMHSIHESFASISAFNNPASAMMEAVQATVLKESPTFLAIRSITEQYDQLLSSFTAINEAVTAPAAFVSQINHLNFRFAEVSERIEAISVENAERSLAEDFDEISRQMLQLSDNLVHSDIREATRDFDRLLKLAITYLNRSKNAGVISLLIIDIFLRIASAHQYVDFLKEKPETSTKDQVEALATKQDSLVQLVRRLSEELKQVKEFRITNIACEVRLKPQARTIVLARLPKDFEVEVISIHHKWIFVSFFHPIDNLPQTGWIKKKYLEKVD